MISVSINPKILIEAVERYGFSPPTVKPSDTTAILNLPSCLSFLTHPSSDMTSHPLLPLLPRNTFAILDDTAFEIPLPLLDPPPPSNIVTSLLLRATGCTDACETAAWPKALVTRTAGTKASAVHSAPATAAVANFIVSCVESVDCCGNVSLGCGSKKQYRQFRVSEACFEYCVFSWKAFFK